MISTVGNHRSCTGRLGSRVPARPSYPLINRHWGPAGVEQRRHLPAEATPGAAAGSAGFAAGSPWAFVGQHPTTCLSVCPLGHVSLLEDAWSKERYVKNPHKVVNHQPLAHPRSLITQLSPEHTSPPPEIDKPTNAAPALPLHLHSSQHLGRRKAFAVIKGHLLSRFAI